MKPVDLRQIEEATAGGRPEVFHPGIALLLPVAILVLTGDDTIQAMSNGLLLIAAAVIGGYLTLNIGSHDVAG